jgi:hypothetical protein
MFPRTQAVGMFLNVQTQVESKNFEQLTGK